VSAPLAGAYGYLNKTGPGKLALTGTNTFSNGVTLETGTLAIGNPAALGMGALDIEHISGVSVVQAIGNQTVANALYFGADAFSIGGSNDLTFSGPIDLGSSQYAPTIVTVTNTGTSVFSGTLTNTAGFVKAGTGTLVLSGARANTYGSTAANGTTTVNGGTLKLDKTTGLAAVPNGSLVVNAGGTLLLGAANQIAYSVPLTLAGGVFQTDCFGEQLGTLKVTANSLIDLGSGMSLLAFANSSGVPWTGGAFLMVSNWAGSIGGGGQTRVVFGGNNSGLTAAQVSLIRFVNPLGFPPGAWAATILSTGETVPLTAAPTISAQPQDRIALVGDSVSFTCAATGIPPSVWQWRCSGTNVPGATGATLFLPNVALNPAGTYAVAVTNIAGSSISNNAVLSVYSSAVPTLSGASVAGNRQFQLGLTGVPGYYYAIWVSTNLSDWAWLQTTSAPFTFTDTNISGFKCRFYRAQYVP
jgi:autotransporter-associated beta strand protein